MTAVAMAGRQMIRTCVDHEHEELVAGIDQVHETATELTSLPADHVAARILAALRWVDETLAPHMAWEETWLFPRIDDRAHTRWATRLVRFEHHQIALQADRLRLDRLRLGHGSTGEAMGQTRCDLIGLEALVRANLERVETFLLPLLEPEADEWTSEWRD